VSRQRTESVEKKKPMIEGLEDFPLELLGLSVNSIERSGGHIKIPLELLPYLKICRLPRQIRNKIAEKQHRYYLSLKVKDLHRDIEGKVKLKKPSRTIKRQDK
jgi:hypothetical protein